MACFFSFEDGEGRVKIVIFSLGMVSTTRVRLVFHKAIKIESSSGLAPRIWVMPSSQIVSKTRAGGSKLAKNILFNWNSNEKC